MKKTKKLSALLSLFLIISLLFSNGAIFASDNENADMGTESAPEEDLPIYDASVSLDRKSVV